MAVVSGDGGSGGCVSGDGGSGGCDSGDDVLPDGSGELTSINDNVLQEIMILFHSGRC